MEHLLPVQHPTDVVIHTYDFVIQVVHLWLFSHQPKKQNKTKNSQKLKNQKKKKTTLKENTRKYPYLSFETMIRWCHQFIR